MTFESWTAFNAASAVPLITPGPTVPLAVPYAFDGLLIGAAGATVTRAGSRI